MRKKTAIFLFDDVEVLDFAGPFEVFSVADQLHDYQLFKVFTFAKEARPIRAVNGLSINPDYTLEQMPQPDLLVIPGGNGSRAVIADEGIIDRLNEIQEKTSLTMSVCSGSRMLAKMGLLNNKAYCTHHQVYPDMVKLVPTGHPKPELRFVGEDELYTSAGVSAGIDLSLHVVTQLYGEEVANATAQYMEYDYPKS